MISQDKDVYKKNRDRLIELGQSHVLNFWQELTPVQRENLMRQISELDFSLLAELQQMALGKKEHEKNLGNLAPTNVMGLGERSSKDLEVLPLGEEALRNGRVAAFLVAGGQATRLGFPGPKGKFPITPVKKKSLFQLHAEKIRAVQEKYATKIPWYIMTSVYNHEETVSFFKANRFFGLDEHDVMFFRQEMLPAFNRQGKILLAAKDSLALNPNGHGGSVKALWDSGALADMKKRGVEYIFYFQVDNVLVKICDPVFIGYHIQAGAEMSNKVVRKENPEDKVGIICKINGRDGVVEYSDLSRKDMYARTDDGNLKYWAGSIAIHILNVDLIERQNKQGFKLPYHRAIKKVPYLDEQGQPVIPKDVNAIKFESFVFDLLFDVKKSFTLEVERKKEFSAVKNELGAESPESARRDLLRYFACVLSEAGFEIPMKADGSPEIDLEVSFLLTENIKLLKKKVKGIKQITDGIYIE